MKFKFKVLKDINSIILDKDIDKRKISIFSMKMFYFISEEFINSNKSIKTEKIYTISSLCADNIECMLNNLYEFHNLPNYTDDELYKLIYNIIIINIKYI